MRGEVGKKTHRNQKLCRLGFVKLYLWSLCLAFIAEPIGGTVQRIIWQVETIWTFQALQSTHVGLILGVVLTSVIGIIFRIKLLSPIKYVRE